MGRASTATGKDSGRSLDVLIVEHDQADVDLCIRVLEKGGFAVRAEVTQTLEEFADRIRARTYDVILADYRMPGWTGIEALIRLQQEGKDIPFILVSGALGDEMAVECLKLGATDYVLKDRLARLPAAVSRALEEKALRDERKWAHEALQALYRANLNIQEPLKLTKRLERLIHVAQTVLKLDRVNIFLADAQDQWLVAAASVGTTESLEGFRIPLGPESGAIAQAYLTKQTIVWDDRSQGPEGMPPKPSDDRGEAVRSPIFAHVPLVVQGRPIGVLRVDRAYSRRPLEAATLELLQLFAGQAALAIENARLYETEQQSALLLEASVEARMRDLEGVMRRTEQASRFKSEFVGTMSHELKIPLNAIIGFSELLREENLGPLNEKQQRYVNHVLTGARHLLGLINDIVDLAKVEAGRLDMQREPLHLPHALKASVESIRPQAEAKGLHLTLNMDDDLPALTADPVRFSQILYNLLTNAIDVTPSGGHLTLSAHSVQSSGPAATSAEPFRAQGEPSSGPEPLTMNHKQHGDFVEIAVQDTGIGIRVEDLPKLFQESTPLDALLGRRYRGTGLGFALTKKLVELHGGQIWAKSAGEGQGSTFVILLPVNGPGDANKR